MIFGLDCQNCRWTAISLVCRALFHFPHRIPMLGDCARCKYGCSNKQRHKVAAGMFWLLLTNGPRFNDFHEMHKVESVSSRFRSHTVQCIFKHCLFLSTPICSKSCPRFSLHPPLCALLQRGSALLELSAPKCGSPTIILIVSKAVCHILENRNRINVSLTCLWVGSAWTGVACQHAAYTCCGQSTWPYAPTNEVQSCDGFPPVHLMTSTLPMWYCYASTSSRPYSLV